MTAAVLTRAPVRRPLPVGLLALPLILFLAAVYFWPVGSLLATSFTTPQPGLEQYRHLFASGVYLRIFAATFEMAVVVTAATLVIAYPVAYHLTVAREGQFRWLIFLILVPSWTSVLVRSFGWLILLGRRGILNNLLVASGLVTTPLPLMFNSAIVELAMVEILLPFMILPLFTTMRGIDMGLVQAASGLGAGRLQAFLRVYLPLSLPGVVAGSSIVFVLSLGFFITPALLGGRRDITAAMLIMQQFEALLNWGFGAALATVLLLLALAMLALFAWAARAGGAERTTR